MPSSPASPQTLPLREVSAAPDFFARVGEVVLKIEASSDTAEAIELLKHATARLGADVAAFLSFIRDDEAWSSFRFLLACDPRWCSEYEERAWYADDPWLEYARTHSEPIRAADIPCHSDTQRSIVELAERFGFRSAAIVPAPSSGGLSRLGMLCVGSRTAGYFADDGFAAFKVVARPLASSLQEWWISRLGRQFVDDAGLRDEDLALLRYEAQGLCSKKLASMLGVAPAAVDSRFQRLIAKLGVLSRREAARLAAEYGLI